VTSSLGALRRALAVLLAFAACAALAPASAGAARGDARGFSGRGMWIWQLEKSSGGNLAKIAEKARRHAVRTVFLKSSDGGTNFWRQFSSTTVRALRRRGLRVCAWQYVYGENAVGEARLGARAVRTGADCLVIDAESEYEGRYGPAVSYLRALRRRIGRRFPVGLTGFPYVDLHPAFPYSVFLGPGGAQFNVPQMYWRAIGTTTSAVFSRTFRWNRPFERPIAPLGQVYQDPPLAEIRRFRTLARTYRARGVSWWVWQDASTPEWGAVGNRVRSGPARAVRGLAALRRGMKGDLVVWAQEHLVASGRSLAVDGGYGRRTQGAVRRFQRLKGLPRTAVIDSRTWRALLRYRPTTPRWDKKRAAASTTSASATAPPGPPASAPAAERSGPPSAWLPARANDLGPRRR
jgi:peptidoglycan hydrolase-like protein with peptidoglycan-binding domain